MFKDERVEFIRVVLSGVNYPVRHVVVNAGSNDRGDLDYSRPRPNNCEHAAGFAFLAHSISPRPGSLSFFSLLNRFATANNIIATRIANTPRSAAPTARSA